MTFEKPSLQILLDQWIHNSQSYENITHVHVNKPNAGNFISFPENLDKSLVNGLNNIGVHNLYNHQIQCLDWVENGRNVLLNTETASGKTLAFLLPILNEFLQKNIPTNSLFLFPTKALTYDQFQQYQNILESVKDQSKEKIIKFAGCFSLRWRYTFIKTFINSKECQFLTNQSGYAALRNFS